MSRAQLHYGGVPVPYTVAWSAENSVHLARCPYARAVALCAPSARGEGKPMFGTPHMNRQREAIALGLCDLCGRPLRNRTKVSLSQAQSRANAHRPFDVLQVEPLLHRECAARCMEHCPSLRKQRREGSLFIRQVFRHACQLAVYSEQGVFEACGVRRKAICHAKVQIIKWADRNLDWLCRREAA